MDIVSHETGEFIEPSGEIDGRGFLVAVLPDSSPDYALNIRYNKDTEAVHEGDPYRFSTVS